GLFLDASKRRGCGIHAVRAWTDVVQVVRVVPEWRRPVGRLRAGPLRRHAGPLRRHAGRDRAFRTLGGTGPSVPWGGPGVPYAGRDRAFRTSCDGDQRVADTSSGWPGRTAGWRRLRPDSRTATVAAASRAAPAA